MEFQDKILKLQKKYIFHVYSSICCKAYKLVTLNLLQMAVAQPDVVDLCFSSEENESSLEEEDSSYDSILVLSQSDDPLPEVPWRFGRAKRNVGSMD